MRILFFTLVKITSTSDSGIYADMVKEFISRGHHVDYYFPLEKEFYKSGKNLSLNSLHVSSKVQKTNNFFIKFLTYLLIDYKLSRVINKSNEHYDLLIIATPSIFQTKILNSFKAKYPHSKVLLLLKDIFPDNALDLTILDKKFPKFILYKYFKFIERKIYSLVDKIGVMSIYNKDYIEVNNPEVKEKLFISPNSIYPYIIPKSKTREDLNLPQNIIITFIGNIGLPQDPYFLRDLILFSPQKVTFLIIGAGSKDYLFKDLPTDKLIFINGNLDKKLLDQYIINSDFGLILLNHKFKVPNFPSKLLSYLNANIPVISLTNEFNDIKELVFKGSIIGYWRNSSNLKESLELLKNLKPKNNDSIIHTEFENYNVIKQIDFILKSLNI
jgi:hypothetical protein